MKTRQSTIAYALFLLLCCLAIATANGQQPTINQIRAASEPDRISDWALAGIVWSDANLAEKLARRAQQEDTPQQDAEALRQIEGTAQSAIAAMKRFGWSQVRRPRQENRRPAGRTDRDTGGRTVRAPRSPSPSREIEFENPVQRDEPDFDDAMRSRQMQTDLDIAHYRIEHVIDDSPEDRADVSRAVKDGVKKAIASTPPANIDIYADDPAHTSARDTQTRSATLPFGPTTNYYEYEYDLVEQAGAPDPDEVPPRSDYRRYTRADGPAIADARWVQFHLDTNQMIWDRYAERDPSIQEVRDALQRLRVHARQALENASRDELRAALDEILDQS